MKFIKVKKGDNNEKNNKIPGTRDNDLFLKKGKDFFALSQS